MNIDPGSQEALKGAIWSHENGAVYAFGVFPSLIVIIHSHVIGKLASLMTGTSDNCVSNIL